MRIFAVCRVYCVNIEKHIYAVHVTLLLCVFRCVCSVMIMKKNANYKLDCIWRNSNSDDDIRPNRVFSAFSLNLTSIRKSPYRIPAGPWGFITVPIPMGIRIPTAAGFYDVRLLLSCSWPTQLSEFWNYLNYCSILEFSWVNQLIIGLKMIVLYSSVMDK